ncbi:hypothetical protein D3C87_1664450 [compost metagenome]
MGQDQVLQALPAQLGHQECRLVVVQMSQFAAHPLLEKVRVVTASQHVTAMVGLDHQCIEVPIAVQHLVAIRAQVGQQAEAPLTVTEDVLRRLLRIVGHGNDTDAQVADLQLLAARQKAGRFNRFAHPAQCAATEVDRQIVTPRQ